MWKRLLRGLKGGGLNQEAFDEALIMLQASHGMHRDAVAALHRQGVLATDIYERDRQLNRYERRMRRKILTHLLVSPKLDVNMGLVVVAIGIDIERIGDYTKNIVELAAGLAEPFDGGELDREIRGLEAIVDRMFEEIVPALRDSDEELARKILVAHKSVSARVEAGLQLLRNDKVLAGQSGKAVTTALYLRYLKRVSAHLKNVATSVVNPFYRLGYREKGKKTGASKVSGDPRGEREDASTTPPPGGRESEPAPQGSEGPPGSPPQQGPP
jgi:phosphate transport system protein